MMKVFPLPYGRPRLIVMARCPDCQGTGVHLTSSRKRGSDSEILGWEIKLCHCARVEGQSGE